ncbi:hypothetical protein BC833DRAFT_604040 [Globomyces pollinis-pini]|nr:hypothetical protein BC833DRAFT_604040 [Globomyces pollinis-pini]
MLFTIASVSILSTIASAGLCNSGNNIPTFDLCVSNGLEGSVSPEARCSSLMNDQPAWFSCLCAKELVMVQCFENFCPGDPGIFGYQGAQASYCGASQQYPVPGVAKPSAVAAGSSIPVPATKPALAQPSGSVNASPNNASPSGSATPESKNDALGNAYLGTLALGVVGLLHVVV